MTTTRQPPAGFDAAQLSADISRWARELGFDEAGIADIELGPHAARLREWLAAGMHGEMEYMERHEHLRRDPAALHPGTVRVISVRMNYLPREARATAEALADPSAAFVSRYALGRDYHRVMRRRLQELASRIAKKVSPFGYRVFADSAPVLERALAEKAGLGWIGKHTNLVSTEAGSWFFLGEILTDLPLPVSTPASNHCGTCQACIDVCPTRAIIAPYRLDARRCISYLTIELRGAIPEELRPGIGNRIFGCDDCQLVCPWNRFGRYTEEADFSPRHELDSATLIALFAWSEEDFRQRTEGSAIRRTGYEGWLRNIAVALGNSLRNMPAGADHAAVVHALEEKLDHPSALVREHVGWALAQRSSGKMAQKT